MQRAALAAYITAVSVVTDRVRQAREQGRERGLTTTEVAVLTFILVSIAVAIGVLLYNYSSNQVAELDDVNLSPVQSETD